MPRRAAPSPLLGDPPTPLPAGRRRWVRRAQRVWAEQREAHERLAILARPWTHDQVHWVPTADGGAELHGSVPPPGRSPGPVTRGGWCPCAAADSDRRRAEALRAVAPGPPGRLRGGAGPDVA